MSERLLTPQDEPAPCNSALLPLVLAFSTVLFAQQAPAQSRGQLLYSTHCVTCHTTQMHWRNNRQAYDWTSLSVQVDRWQGNEGLKWADADVLEVTRYLNETIYKFPQSDSRMSLNK